MILDDHINLQNSNPLIGPNRPEFGPRFPDMSCPYNKELTTKALEFAQKENIRAHTGVYVAVSGPNLETRAEYRFFENDWRRCGWNVNCARGHCGKPYETTHFCDIRSYG